jgi:dipeptidyl aminopeptidase/acylaminoacyl peptidase
MQRDFRNTPMYREAEQVVRKLRAIGSGDISDASELNGAPDGSKVVFSGTVASGIDGVPSLRICEVDLRDGTTRILTSGPGTDRLPKFSPDGSRLAFLSDRERPADFQLYFRDARGAVTPGPKVDGWVEYLHWSPDGRRILLATAGHGADTAGGFGAITTKLAADGTPAWTPLVETGDEDYLWRNVWICDLDANTACKVNAAGTNIWEAVWCGPDAIAAVVSPGPSEGLWYSAKLILIDVASGAERELYVPKDQLGWPSASPSGRHMAIVEAVASDRWIVAGDLVLLDIQSGKVTAIDTRGIDVSCIQWRSETRVSFAGHRGLDTNIGYYDTQSATTLEEWTSRDITTGGRYISCSWTGDAGDCVLCGEGFFQAPEIATVRGGKYKRVVSFDNGYAEELRALAQVQAVRWRAPDGRAIEGWLMLPRTPGPHALVLEIHGGPVWQWRPRWLARDSLHALMLVRHGYAVFWPNPRGSAGGGREFAGLVQGDMGGADTHDFLSGIDHLVAKGIADKERLGVTGRSYGGFMACWLITQDTRFAAAIPLAPSTNKVSAHLTSNIPQFTSLYLNDHFTNPSGKYFERSPIMHAHKARTPTMNVCGALDRCTPPTEARQFHNALLEAGVESVLVTYPLEGHGNRQLPAVVDYAARVVTWFEKYMPPGRA